MSHKEINDLTDVFDVRLESLQKSRAPAAEHNAAITVYERVRTARAICQALLPTGFSEATVVTLAVELGREAALQTGQSPNSVE